MPISEGLQPMGVARQRPGGQSEASGSDGRPSQTPPSTGQDDEAMVSLRAEVPLQLLRAMGQFIERHPHWDQYRLVQAALAGFLVQHGVQNRGVTRCYLANLFPSAKGFGPLPNQPDSPANRPGPQRGQPPIPGPGLRQPRRHAA